MSTNAYGQVDQYRASYADALGSALSECKNFFFRFFVFVFVFSFNDLNESIFTN